jgi:nicotinamide mononucleotide transporter
VAECLGFTTGIACVWLAARNNIWNFVFGILNSALLLLLFLQARLLADATLQVMFITLGVRGWWQWARHGTAAASSITTASSLQWRTAIICSVAGTVALTTLLTLVKGSVPFFDASITALSLVAQWLLNRRVLQSWWWWMAVDLISIPVYIYKGLYLIALLYVIFLALCISGYHTWRSQLRLHPNLRGVPA